MIDFAAIGHEGRHWVYEATVAPRLWHASRRADFRIWQNQTVPDILYQVLGENAVRFDMRLKARYKRWTYLVQYRETDLSFICRQLEHEGIFFWFEHGADGETLVLADHLSAHPECPGYATVSYYSGVQTRPDRDHFDAWRLTRRVEPGRLIHADYDFERPSSDLTTEYADPRADQNLELTLVAVSYDITDNDYEGTLGMKADGTVTLNGHDCTITMKGAKIA